MFKYKNKKIAVWVGMLMAILTSGGCKKLVEASAPITSVNGSNVFASDATAASTLTGIYTKMSTDDASNSGFTSISIYSSLSADELSLYSGVSLQGIVSFYKNQLNNQTTPNYWTTIYPVVYQANAGITGLSSASSLTPGVRQQLLGEAKFMRAFCYFYLANFYGDVPLVTTTDYKANSLLSRAPQANVYKQIISDLSDAEGLLSTSYLQADALTPYATTAEQRVRPTKWAAAALLARTYLYTGNWDSAELQATTVLNNSSEFSLTGLDSAFLKNSKEAIWQLQPVLSGANSNTGEGGFFILPATGPSSSYPAYLSSNILNSFETGDQRKVHWMKTVTPSPGTTTYYYPYKYKVGYTTTSVQEYVMMLRLSELYLVRAEARSQQNNISGAQADLNVVRSRAKLSNTTAGDKASLLTAILQERRVELFTEWGNRWLDLKRSGTIDATMGPACTQKGGSWDTRWQWYPLPLTDIQYGINLTQNGGY